MKRAYVSLAIALAAAAACAETFTWDGPPGGAWGGNNWISGGSSGSVFANGGDAVFGEPGDDEAASVVVDANVVASNITAYTDTTVASGQADDTAWQQAYTRFRFYIDGTRSDNGMMQLSEIQLIGADGQAIPSTAFAFAFDPEKYGLDNAYPGHENPTNAVDGNVSTKWLDYRAGNTRTAEQRAAAWFEFRFAAPTNISGYAWYTANDADSRDPAAWRLLGSNDDGATWTVLDKVVGYAPTKVRNVLGFRKSFAGWTRYRFKVDAVRTYNDEAQSVLQISDVALYGSDGRRFVRDTDFTLAWSEGAPTGGEGVQKAVDTDANGDGVLTTKWLDSRLLSKNEDVWIEFDLYTRENISRYEWYTANDTHGYWTRNPTSFRLQASDDNGATWHDIDNVTNDTSLTTENYTRAYAHDFPVPLGATFEVSSIEVAEGKTLTLKNGLDMAPVPLAKTGAGELVFEKGAGMPLDLRAGTVAVKSSGLNPFSATADALKIAGRLDLGGSTQSSSTSGDRTAVLCQPGGELVNGTIDFNTAQFFDIRGDFTIGAGGILNLPGNENKGQLCIGNQPYNGAQVVRLTLKDGGEINEHSSRTVAYIGTDQADAVVTVVSNGFLHIDNHDTYLGKGGRTGTIVADDGRLDFNRKTLRLGGDGTGHADMYLTNSWLKVGYVVAGGDSSGSSRVDFEMVGSSRYFEGYGFSVKHCARCQMRFGGGLSLYMALDNDDIFSVDDAYTYASEPPFVLLEGGVSLLWSHNLGISTTLVGAGGITIGDGSGSKPTVTFHVDQAYTGATVVKAGATLVVEPETEFAGPIVVEDGGILQKPDIPAGMRFVKFLRAPSYEGIDFSRAGHGAICYFMMDGWLCYGLRRGLSISVR